MTKFKLTNEKNEYAEFTRADLNRIEVALRLREEACQDNEEHSEASLWYKTRRKILYFLQWKD